MAIDFKNSKLLRILIYVLLALLIGAGIFMFFQRKQVLNERNIAAKERYVKQYQAEELSALKKRNKELYDSIMAYSDKKPESALEIRYKYKYKTDTIYKTEFKLKTIPKEVVTERLVPGDTVYVKETMAVLDSIWHYEKDNDTIQTTIDLKAKDLEWVKVEANIHDKFIIVNRTDNNGNIETTIDHSPNVEIDGVTAWHKKKSWKDRLFIGPTIGVGYDPVHKTFSPNVGISVGFNLWKH